MADNFASLEALIRKLSLFPVTAQTAITILIRDLAMQTLDELNRASGIEMQKDDNLLVYTLNAEHWKRMPHGDICDQIASRETEFGIGIFSINKLPEEVHLGGDTANIHPNCHCLMIPFNKAMGEKSWKVIINEKGVEFLNESTEIEEKINGTAPVLEGSSVKQVGEDPDRYAEEIINSFLNNLQVGVEKLLMDLIGAD